MSNKHEQVSLLWITRLAVIVAALGCGASNILAQFSSGSTGADGPLNITTPGVTNFTQMPMGGGNIYNFTTINVASGSTLKISGQTFPYPLYFLAQGTVTISGTIDISGANGYSSPQVPSNRSPSVPGPGGYSGGLGAIPGSPAQIGNGPGGGGFTIPCSITAAGGSFTGNQFLVPLVGGSGGAGGAPFQNLGGGGAGGGALLIASSTSINVSGTITAQGGLGGSDAGSGSGGAIRLIASLITGPGQLLAGGGGNTYSCNGTNWDRGAGGPGIVRLEAFSNTFTGFINGGRWFNASPFGLFLPTTQPSISVVSIGGVPVPPSPTGSFTVPDVIVNSTSPLQAQIQAQNVPVGTVVTLSVSSENGPDQALTATLQGTADSSTATATVTLPPGYSRGYVKASWTQ